LSISKQQKPHRQVVIVQRCVTTYRVPLFEQLKQLLEQDGIELRLLYGDATKAEQSKRDTVDIAWGEKLSTHYLWGNRLCWQPFYSKIKAADLVIVTQENKLLANLWPLFGWRSYKLAFWGHGKNMQSANTRWSKLKEAVKYITTTRVDWWFVYTGISQAQVAQLGFSSNKITNLENSVDTSALKQLCESVTSAEVNAIRAELKLGNGPVGLYVGSLYKDKRLDFLLNACLQIVQKIPDFRLVIIGDGPDRPLISDAQAEYHWLCYVGRQVDANKAKYLKLASVLLNPGLVGLGILDAFAAGIPMITTDCGFHSPEIDYLYHGENGFMTENTLEAYVKTVLNILENAELAAHLSKGSLASSERYTVENMALNFRSGILKALG
jgi:glycosyltransferase involved in cell wall biosynthesis